MGRLVEVINAMMDFNLSSRSGHVILTLSTRLFKLLLSKPYPNHKCLTIVSVLITAIFLISKLSPRC